MIRPLYKSVEPFMEVKRGFGYQGVIQYDDQEDKVQCHICGKWFKTLPQHLRNHQITSADYRRDYGLPMRGGLVSVKVSAERSRLSSRPEMLEKLDKHRENAWAVKANQSKMQKIKAARKTYLSHNTMAAKNRIGLCPLQIKARYLVVKQIVGHDPSIREIRENDSALKSKLLRIGFNKWKKSNGFSVIDKNKGTAIFGDIELIAILRSWYKKHGKNPAMKDFKRGSPTCVVFSRAFGSWQNALTQAGLK